jgi:hypothetical protein
MGANFGMNMPNIFVRFMLALIACQKAIANHKSIVMGAGLVILWVSAVWRLVQQVHQMQVL